MNVPDNYIYYNVSQSTIRTKFQSSDEVQVSKILIYDACFYK